MSFRKPPSDVDRMTSLRVGNLPFRTTSEVSGEATKLTDRALSANCIAGVTASV